MDPDVLTIQAGPHVAPGRRRAGLLDRTPLWLVAAGLIAVGFGLAIAFQPGQQAIFSALIGGVGTTLLVSAVSFGAALLLGLGLALARLSGWRLLRETATFIIEIIRGVPVLVLLFYMTFVLAPALVAGWNTAISALLPDSHFTLQTRDFSLLWRAVLALAIGYSAFLAEIFRAGIEAVGQGQVEAAKALGLTGTQRLRLVVLPQAFRTVLPPLGNDLVSMIKDSSLVSVLGVQDITQLGKVYSSLTFLFFETYSILAYLYLLMTISLSLGVRAMEHRLRASERR